MKDEMGLERRAPLGETTVLLAPPPSFISLCEEKLHSKYPAKVTPHLTTKPTLRAGVKTDGTTAKNQNIQVCGVVLTLV